VAQTTRFIFGVNDGLVWGLRLNFGSGEGVWDETNPFYFPQNQFINPSIHHITTSIHRAIKTQHQSRAISLLNVYFSGLNW
jgi:hypothetical protein